MNHRLTLLLMSEYVEREIYMWLIQIVKSRDFSYICAFSKYVKEIKKVCIINNYCVNN